MMQKVSRRKFIRYAAGIGAGLLITRLGLSTISMLKGGEWNTLVKSAKASSTTGGSSSGPKYAYVVDVGTCIGCRKCVEACKIENGTPQGIFWMELIYPTNADYKYLPRPCMHCNNPPCAKVCPVTARYKRDDGLVLTDFGRCIGCRYCEVACPYGVNHFNWSNPKGTQGELGSTTGILKDYRDRDGRETAGGGHSIGVMEKCTWCVQRIDKGKLLPACVEICPVHALHFGDLNDPNSDVSKFVSKNKYFRLLDELGTEPKVYYVGGYPLHEQQYASKGA